MNRHKWAPEQETEWGTKPHRCIKCGIRKMWNGGDYQAWNYSWNEIFTMTVGGESWRTITTWNRPECKPIIKKT